MLSRKKKQCKRLGCNPLPSAMPASPSSTCFIMTYHLPITLSRSPDGAWSAAWVADNICAKTPNSIATDNGVMWMGVVSRSCMDAPTLAYLARQPFHLRGAHKCKWSWFYNI